MVSVSCWYSSFSRKPNTAPSFLFSFIHHQGRIIPKNTTTRRTISTPTPSTPIHPSTTIFNYHQFHQGYVQYKKGSNIIRGSNSLKFMQGFIKSFITSFLPHPLISQQLPLSKKSIPIFGRFLMLSYYNGYMTPPQNIFSSPSSSAIQTHKLHGKSCLTFSVTTKTIRFSIQNKSSHKSTWSNFALVMLHLANWLQCK